MRFSRSLGRRRKSLGDKGLGRAFCGTSPAKLRSKWPSFPPSARGLAVVPRGRMRMRSPSRGRKVFFRASVKDPPGLGSNAVFSQPVLCSRPGTSMTGSAGRRFWLRPEGCAGELRATRRTGVGSAGGALPWASIPADRSAPGVWGYSRTLMRSDTATCFPR